MSSIQRAFDQVRVPVVDRLRIDAGHQVELVHELAAVCVANRRLLVLVEQGCLWESVEVRFHLEAVFRFFSLHLRSAFVKIVEYKYK